jgi:hypothetical protein
MPTDFEESILSPALKVVAAHWLAARRGRKTPGWAALMSTAIKAQLPIVWSYTYDPDSDLFTGRLAGERVAGLFGNDFRGLPMSEAPILKIIIPSSMRSVRRPSQNLRSFTEPG